MSTEWLQIIIASIVVVPLIILTGRYLHWRRWDRERRINRMARRQGLREYYAALEEVHKGARRAARHPGFSVKVP